MAGLTPTLLYRWYGRIGDRFLIYQKTAFLRWAAKFGGLKDDEEIAFLLDADEFFCYTEAEQTKTRKKDPLKSLAYIFVRRGTFKEKTEPYRSNHHEEWQQIYESSVLEIWENRKRHLKQLPFRFGYSPEEKNMVLREVRRMLGELLSSNSITPPSTLSPRFDLPQDLDIAVWVDGKIRASVIMTGLSCREALIQGVRRVPQDGRFAPLEIDELSRATVEITMMEKLEIPLTFGEFVRGDIDPTKGYHVRAKSGGGYYLPEVHNALAFKNLHELCLNLALKKARINPNHISYRNFFLFSVTDWVERGDGYLDLSGPVPIPDETPLSNEEVKKKAECIIEHLVHLMDSHGRIAPIIEPGYGQRNSMDWLRLGCVGHALAVYGKTMSYAPAKEAGEKIYAYLDRYTPFSFLRGTDRFMTQVYFTRLGLVLGKRRDQKRNAIIDEVREHYSHFRSSPITILQALTLLLEEDSFTEDGRYVEEVGAEAVALFDTFKRTRNSLQLALYPELMAVFTHLQQETGERKWKQYVFEMAQWYKGEQLPDGSFPHSPGRIYAYTRGTGKIFEVFTIFPETNERVLERVWRWLETMQYTRENTFHLHPDERKLFIGGFRHDAFNRESWIDAAAHIVLGAARWLSSGTLRKKQF